MTSKERMMRALRREEPDRLPCTVHQWQRYHLDEYLGGVGELEAFQRFGLDAALQYFESTGQSWVYGEEGSDRAAPDWMVEVEVLDHTSEALRRQYRVRTPSGSLSYRTEGNCRTTWITEHLVKHKEDIDLVARHMPVPKVNRESVQRAYDQLGDAGILRGFVWGDQAGCWQHACCLFGMQEMILAALDDPSWAHRFLRILCDKKLQFVEESLVGASFDLIETGGGAGSSTVISPAMHREFCLPHDREVHHALHRTGHLVAYHTCGGMMPLAEMIAGNGADATETMAPRGVGGDVDAAELKRKVGDRLCLIGGMDQFNVLTRGTDREIRAEVQRLFAAAGAGGGYILSCADHFFDTPPANLQAYAHAARECVY